MAKILTKSRGPSHDMQKTTTDYCNDNADRLALKVAQQIRKERRPDDYQPRKRLTVGGFGLTKTDGYTEVIYWSVGDRKDRRHGIVNPPAVTDPYNKLLFEEMFKKWQTS